MAVRPLSPPALVEELAARIAARALDRWLRVAVDGPAAADPEALATDLVDPLRVRGRPALQVPAGGFLRPASVRLELGRTNPDAFYERWWDHDALRREVLEPLGPGGTGRVLPSRWDPDTDRATREPYRTVPDGGVVLVGGPLLLGTGFPFDLVVHLALSPAALARRTPAAARWTLPAYARYQDEVRPEAVADLVVRLNDPAHPALVDDS